MRRNNRTPLAKLFCRNAVAAGAARRRRRRTEETYASSDEEASQLLVAFLESARNRRVPSIAEDDGGWGDASGSDAEGDAS